MNTNTRWMIRCSNRHLVLVFASLLLLFIFSIVCNSINVSAAARQSSITVELSNSTISTNATPNRLANSNEQTITVRTDNFTGYTLSIEATNNNARNLSDGNGHSIETITSAITTNEFSNNANYANKWGYKPNQYITTTAGVNTTIQNENYLPAPTAQGDTLDITTEANSNNNSYTVGFGAKVDNTMPAGAYSSIFVYRTIANDIGYVIYYDENTEDQVDNMPDPNPEAATLPGGTVTADSYITLSDATPTRTGFTFSGWCDEATTEDSTTHSQTCPGNTYAAGADYGIDQTLDNTNIELYAVWVRSTSTITLDGNGATNAYTTSTTATYGEGALSMIATLPTKASTTGTRTISGFTAGTNASGATITYDSNSTCTSASSCTSTNTTSYDFNGWYKEAATTNKIAGNTNAPNLLANTSYTDANGKWTNDGAVTLYAGYTTNVGAYSSVTLPTITKTGYDCGWSTNQSATNYTYASGASLTPDDNKTLYGICEAKTYTVELNQNGATASGSTSTTATYGSTTLAPVTNPSRSYTISGFDTSYNNASGASVSSTSTITSNYTFNGWYTASSGGTKIASNATTPALQASTTYTNSSSQWTYTTASAVTLYAQWTSASVSLPTITKTGHTCGWSTSTSTSTITYSSGASFTPSANTTLYGVCKTNTYSLYIDFADSGTTTKYSKTSNIDNSGTASGTYSSNLATNDVVAISGASSLAVDLYYSTEANWDYLYIFQGTYSGTPTKNMSAGQLYTYNGGNNTTFSGANHVTVTVPGDTATFSFYSDGSQAYYGYYAIVRPVASSISSVQVRTASGTSGTLMGTVSSSGGYVSGLSYGTSYYLRPIFNSSYDFSSWAKTAGYGALSSTSTSNPYFTMGAGNGTVTITGKSNIVTFDQAFANAGKSKQSGYYKMQDASSSICSTVTQGQIGQLIDTRDSNVYYVSKLADDRCWMLDNLRLDLTNSTVKNILSASNTNATDTSINYLKYGGGSSSDQYAMTGVANWTSGYTFSDPLVNLTNKDVIPTDDISTAGGYKVGGYYNYCAATAGSYCYGNGTSAGTPSGNATEDICPKGWSLPTGGPTGKFQSLYNNSNYNNYAKYRAALRLPLSGYFGNGSTYDQSNAGGWWSSTRATNNYMYYLNVNTVTVNPANYYYRSDGVALRCLAQQ